ncbi:hypothetical protein SCARR_00274 [Pontiella sulfatireligans]|uniref:Uncharacterized protein n=1 Tax=Pontiella sulfatireligans TaxID=2750658 RepID=A0A6C2UED0_9BACT|nr:hypothetical protein SCARR_00274 [Pontiella sulfatireligans]
MSRVRVYLYSEEPYGAKKNGCKGDSTKTEVAQQRALGFKNIENYRLPLGSVIFTALIFYIPDMGAIVFA